jgi:hypothetical protein
MSPAGTMLAGLNYESWSVNAGRDLSGNPAKRRLSFSRSTPPRSTGSPRSQIRMAANGVVEIETRAFQPRNGG